MEDLIKGKVSRKIKSKKNGKRRINIILDNGISKTAVLENIQKSK